MKNKILPVVLILLSAATLTYGQQDKLGVTLDLTYLSKWLSKGVQAYGQQGAFFKTVDIDFYGTGFGLKVKHRNATSSGYVDKQRFDYRPYYKSRLFEDKPYVTNYNLSVGYEHYPGLDRHTANTTFEWVFAFSWPKILPGGLVPGYIAHYEYPASGGQSNRKVAGWVHRFLLGYDINVLQLPNPLHLSTEVAYYDGLGNKGHDWAYFTTGLSTKFKLNDNLSFIPGVYHQISMEDSVNTNDVTYVALSMKYKF